MKVFIDIFYLLKHKLKRDIIIKKIFILLIAASINLWALRQRHISNYIILNLIYTNASTLAIALSILEHKLMLYSWGITHTLISESVVTAKPSKLIFE